MTDKVPLDRFIQVAHALMTAPRFDLKRAQDRMYRNIADQTPASDSPATAPEIAAWVNEKFYPEGGAISALQVGWAARKGYITRVRGNPPRFHRNANAQA